ALNFIGFYAAAVESALLIWLSIDKHGVADRAIHEHGSGWLIRIGETLTGPLALVLRFFGLVPFAAVSLLTGALVSRIGWIAVGGWSRWRWRRIRWWWTRRRLWRWLSWWRPQQRHSLRPSGRTLRRGESTLFRRRPALRRRHGCVANKTARLFGTKPWNQSLCW